MSNINDNAISAGLTEYFWDILRDILDPEIGVNIVDLGMVYGIDVVIHEQAVAHDDKADVVVTMTLTSPACPLADVIKEEVATAIMNTNKCSRVKVIFVFDPPWHRDMISEEGKMQLGLL